MRLTYRSLLSAGIFVILFSSIAFSDTPPPSSEPTTTWECSQADGTLTYTNKEKAGCRAMTLKPLSVVPDLDSMPTIPQPVSAAPRYQAPSYMDGYPGRVGHSVPEWARDWHARIAPEDSVQEEVCSLYSEWLHLVQKTRGGFFFGTDPSYGGDITGRNLHGPSYSYYDNARWVALSRIFGTGFVPVGCR
jgi:hypothetical protein